MQYLLFHCLLHYTPFYHVPVSFSLLPSVYTSLNISCLLSPSYTCAPSLSHLPTWPILSPPFHRLPPLVPSLAHRASTVFTPHPSNGHLLSTYLRPPPLPLTSGPFLALQVTPPYSPHDPGLASAVLFKMAGLTRPSNVILALSNNSSRFATPKVFLTTYDFLPTSSSCVRLLPPVSANILGAPLAIAYPPLRRGTSLTIWSGRAVLAYATC